MILLGAGMEIGAQPVAQVDRLANINDLPPGIFHYVATSSGGGSSQNALQVLSNIHRPRFYHDWGRWWFGGLGIV